MNLAGAGGGADDLGGGDGAELRAVAFGRFQVRFVRLGELLLDRQRDALAHGALAVAAVDDDVEAAVEGEGEEVALDDVHEGRANYGESFFICSTS